MGKSFSVYTAFKAKDEVTPVFKNMTQGANTFKGKLDKLTNSMTSVKSGFKAAAGTFAAFFAVEKIKEFGKISVDAAVKELAAQEKLIQVLKNNAAIRARGQNEYLKASKDLINFASEIQKKGIIGDEVLVGGMQTLGSMGFDDKVIKKMTPIIADLAVQQKGYNVEIQDAETIAKGLGRALAGNTGALSRMGVVLDKNQKKALENMNTQKRAEYLYKLLAQRVGGLNEQMAKTDQGAKIQALNNWSDRLEDIGKRIIPIEGHIYRLFNRSMPYLSQAIEKFFNNVDRIIKASKPIFNELSNNFKYFAKNIGPEFIKLTPGINNLFYNVLIPGIVAALKTLNKFQEIAFSVYNFLKSAFIPLLPILSGFLAGLAVYKTVQFFQALQVQLALLKMNAGGGLLVTLKNLTLGIMTSVKAILAQNAALLSSPLFWIPALIVGIIALVVLLYKNWDKITAVMSVWWNNTKEWLNAFGTQCIEVFTGLWNTIKAWFSNLGTKCIDVFTFIGNTVKNLFLGFWETCKSVFGRIGAFIKDNFINILLAALGPIGLIIKGFMKIGEHLGAIKSNKMSFNMGGDYNLTDTNMQPPLVTNNHAAKIFGSSGVIEVRNIVENKNNSLINSNVSLLNSHNLTLNPA